MTNGIPKTPVPSGARLAGDDYQHLYTWFHALHLLRELDNVTRVEFEKRDAGNVDDIVAHRLGLPALYHQIKFVVDQRELLSCDWFSTAPSGAKASPLQRFDQSFRDLSEASGPPEMALYTNRHLTPNDPILKHLDSRTDKLGPRFFDAGGRSATGNARKDWATHVGVSGDDLAEMLTHLRIFPGQGSLDHLRQGCGILMEAVGLRGDIAAVSLGTNEIRQLIINGCQMLELDEMNEIVGRLGLRTGTQRGTLMIEALAHHPWPAGAAATVDWVDDFHGNEPRERRRTIDPDAWNEKFKPELDAAASAIRSQGYTDVRLDGAFRLSMGFAAGAALQRAAGLTISFRDWVSSAAPADVQLSVVEHELAQGDELAVAIAVSGDLTDEVLAYLRAAKVPVAKLVVLSPETGPGQASVPGEAEAVGIAYSALEQIRLAGRTVQKVHLFANCPNAVVIFLGHLWNRMPTTQLYDDGNDPTGYFPTFTLVS